MDSLYKQVFNAASYAIESAFNEHADPVVRWSDKPGFGDIQINAAMGLAKAKGENPREVAQKIVDNLDLSQITSNVEIAGPGFINITFSNEALSSYASELAVNSTTSAQQSSTPQRIVVDYGGPNIAKEMHIGHLRSSVIGDALVRIFNFLGHTTIRQDHLGDWGTQFGMLVEFMVKDGKVPDQLPELKDLNDFYRQASAKYKEDEEFAVKARARVALLQGGDEDSLRAWRHIYDETMKHVLEIYSRLGVLLTSKDSRGESFYNHMLADVCEDLEKRSLAIVDEGALCVYKEGVVDREGNPFGLIIRKSDGGYGYGTTDIAALKYSAEKDKADRVIYVVDARQSQHFEIVFDVCERAGYSGKAKPTFAGFGTIVGNDGKPFKTRSGEVVKLSVLLDEAMDRANSLLADRSSDLNSNEREELAKAIGVGSIKYSDLSNNRIKNYVFDFDRMITMEGNTAPYLQYAIARINSLLRKAEGENVSSSHVIVTNDFEAKVVKELSKFGQTLIDVEETLEPHRLCTYLFDLAQTFTSFYENCPVLKEEDESIRRSRLALSSLVANTLRTGIGLLGIESPERL